MRLSSSVKAVAIMINHVAATHYPGEIIHPRIFGRAGSSGNETSLNTTSPLSGSPDISLGVAMPLVLPPGLKNFNMWDYKESCQGACSKDKKCPSGEIRDPDDCTKCTECKSGEKPSADGTKCEADKEDKYQKKKTEKYHDYKPKGYDKIKEVKGRQYQDKRDEEKRRKVRRMSRCLALVPLSMGSSAVDEFDELFDEEWTDSMDMLEFWPEGLEVDPWEDDSSDELYEQDEYVDKWINIGENVKRGDDDEMAGHGVSMAPHVLEQGKPASEPTQQHATMIQRREVETKKRRSNGNNHDKIPAKFIRDARTTATSTDVMVRDPNLSKRCPICFLIPIFAALFRTAAVVVRAVAQIAKGAVRVVKGRNTRSKREQRDGADKVAKDKNWRNCLTGSTPMA